MKLLMYFMIVAFLIVPSFSHASDMNEEVALNLNYQVGGGFYTVENRPETTPYGLALAELFFLEIPSQPSNLKFNLLGLGVAYTATDQIFGVFSPISLVYKKHIGVNFNFNLDMPLTSGFSLMYQF